MSEDLLSKILSGTADAEERRTFYESTLRSAEAQDTFFRTKSLWVRASAGSCSKQLDLDEEYHQLEERLNSNKKKVINLTRRLLSRAAIVLVLLSIGWGAHQWFSSGFEDSGLTQKFASTTGSVSQLTLPDGTQIWLNSGSEILYHQDKNGRNVNLVGEACFDVVHNEKLPFYVHTSELVIRDIGTRFNVSAYPEDKRIETTLIRGNVDILTKGYEKIVNLKPGELASYCKDKKNISIEKVEPENVVAWMDGKFVFRDKTLIEICHELEKWYGVKFQFTDEGIKNYRYTATIRRSTSVTYVLKMLNITTHLNYRIVEHKIKPDLIIISTEPK